MANTRMRKRVAMLAVLAMVVTLVPIVAFASNTVSIDKAEFTDAAEPTIHVTGSLSGDGDITLLALRSAESLGKTIPSSIDEDAIMYIDQKTAENGTVDMLFTLRDTSATGNYITVFMGGTDVVSYVHKEIILMSEPENPISEEDIDIVLAEDDAPVYEDIIDGDNVVLTIESDTIDPAAKKITVGGMELFYVAARDCFVGIVPKYESNAALLADVVISGEPSDTLVYGKDPINGEPDEPIDSADYMAVKRLALGKVANPTVKQILSADIGNGEMDGCIDSSDFMAVKRVALGKDNDLAINSK